MATDVGAILAALATGSQAGANTGTGGNDSGINRVVGITLRLIADPGNPAVVKELTDQVSGAVHKAVQEMEELRGRVRSRATEWATSVGHTMSSAWVPRATDDAHSTGKTAAKLQERHAGEEQSPLGPHNTRRGARTPDSRREKNSGRTNNIESKESRVEQFEKGTEELGDVGSHLIGLAKRVAILSAPDEKTSEQRKKAFESVENIYGVAEDGLKIVQGVGKVAKNFSAAATVGQTGARAVRTATKAAGAAETASLGEGLGGAAIGFGTNALAGMGPAAAAAGAGALLVGAGIAIHDVLAKLTGKFETISGAAGDLLGSIKRSSQLEEKMNEQRAAQTQALATIAAYEGRIAKAAEGRARILEAQKIVGELNLQADREQVAWRSAVRKQMRPAATTKEQSEADKRADARQEMTETLGAFDRDIAEKEKAYDLARRRVAVAQLNQERRQKTQVISFEGGDDNKKLNPDAGQANPSLLGAAGRGITDVFSFDEIRSREAELRNVGRARGERDDRESEEARRLRKSRGFDEPKISPPKDLLQEKLTEQQGMAKAAQDITESIQKRGAFLQLQSDLMKQQLQTSRDLVISTKEQLTLAEHGAHSRLAYFAGKSKDEQIFLKNVLHKINTGQELTPAEARRAAGEFTGDAGDAVSKAIAKTAIPGFERELKAAGDDAFRNLGKAQRENTAANTAVKEDEESDNWIHMAIRANTANAQRHGIKAIKGVVAAEQTRSQQEGYPDPSLGIVKNGEGIREDLKELGKTINTQFKLIRAEISDMGQRIKSGHN
jgi:hypothetical protein